MAVKANITSPIAFWQQCSTVSSHWCHGYCDQQYVDDHFDEIVTLQLCHYHLVNCLYMNVPHQRMITVRTLLYSLLSCGGNSEFVVTETILVGLRREWWLPWWLHGVLTRLLKFEPIEKGRVVGMSCVLTAGWEDVVVATGDKLVAKLVGWEHIDTLPGWRSSVVLRPAELVDETLSYPGLPNYQ